MSDFPRQSDFKRAKTALAHRDYKPFITCPKCFKTYFDMNNIENIEQFGECLMCEEEHDEQFNLE